MINLLPPEEKKHHQHELTFRLTIISLILFSGAFLIGVILLTPAYLIANINEKAVLKELSFLEGSEESTERERISAELLTVKENLSALADDIPRESFYSIIDIVAAYHGDAIKLSHISYGRETGEKPSELRIGGKADRRDDLLSFTEDLKKNELFSDVILPVSSLAKDRDIEFSIEIKGMF